MHWRGWTPDSRSRCRCRWPLPSIGRGVHELRLRDRSGGYRIVHVTARSGEIVVVLAFEKTTFKTPERMIKLARSRAMETE